MERLRGFLIDRKADAIVINKEENLQYFSGFRGDDTMLIVSRDDDALLVTDFRYTEQAKAQAPHYEIAEQKHGLLEKVAECIESHKYKNIAFEGNALIYDDYSKLSGILKKSRLNVPVNLSELRVVKEEEEIRLIRKAAEIGDAAFDDIIKFIKPGVSENDVAARLENVMRSLGSERPSFTTIVASGERGSLPHGVATEKLIVDGEFVTMDFGAVYGGYHSDMTRTVAVGRADDRQREVYDAVLRAQLHGLAEVKPGASGKHVDAVARDELSAAGFGENFGHGLGHSLGLEIHEEPRLSPSSTCEALKPNMLVTVEPGVYIAGWGGLRIEDTVLVTGTGNEPLTKSTKKLIEILSDAVPR